MTERQRDLLRKVRALAEQGAPGEREAAQARLEALIQKYGLTDDVFVDDEETLIRHIFTYKGRYEKQLLTQIACKICPEHKMMRYTRGKGARTEAFIDCTKAKGIQIGIEFDFYKAVWAEEVGIFFKAFIQKHALFDIRPGHSEEVVDDETYERLLSMMGAIKDRELHLRLEDGKNGTNDG